MSGKYSAVRPAGREHVPLLPKGFIAIRIVQLVVAVVVLGISAFTLSTYPFRSNGLSTFTVSSVVCLSASPTQPSFPSSFSPPPPSSTPIHLDTIIPFHHLVGLGGMAAGRLT